MKILYVWVEKYPFSESPFFKNQGFNFSSKYRFWFDSRNLSLSAELNNKYIKNFYNIKGNKVSELTCVVGMNGAGKTLLLELIRLLFVKGYSTSDFFRKSKMLVVWEKNEKLYYDWGGYNDIIQPKNLEVYKKSIEYFKNNTEVVFYSNMFDCRFEESFPMEGFSNISTNYLINRYSDNLRENLQYLTSPDKVNTYKREETKSLLIFFNQFSEIINKQKFPCRQIEFSIHPNEMHDSRKKRYENSFEEFFEYIENSKYIEKLLGYLKKQSNKGEANFEQFAWRAVKSYFYLYLDEVAHYANFINMNCKLPTLPKTFEDFTAKYTIWKFVDWFLIELTKTLFPNQILSQGETINNEFAENFIPKIKSFSNFLTIIKKALDCVNLPHLTSQSIIFGIEDKFEEIKLALDNYFDSLFLTGDYISFTWLPELSAGQKAYLTLFSRLYKIVVDSNKYSNKKLPQNLLVLIDEGELGFHPQWQKEYIDTILNWIGTIFTSAGCEQVETIQLVVATNTPLILSDMLSENVIYLKNGKVDDKKYKTFAANVSDLYLEPFFIEDGLVGNLAKRKIEEVFNQLKEGDLPDNKTDEIFLLLEHINDEFIASYLKNKFQERRKIKK